MRSNPGLKLANAFGVHPGLKLANAFGVHPGLKLANAFGVKRNRRIMRNLLKGVLILLSLTTAAYAQQSTVIEGVGIGTSYEEAKTILGRIGTGGGRNTRDGGRKEAWSLKETDFMTLAFKTNGKGRIVWVSAFVRPGKEVQFSKFGDLTKATSSTRSQAIWNVGSARGGYRLVVKGAEGKANVVYLLSLDFPETD